MSAEERGGSHTTPVHNRACRSVKAHRRPGTRPHLVVPCPSQLLSSLGLPIGNEQGKSGLSAPMGPLLPHHLSHCPGVTAVTALILPRPPAPRSQAVPRDRLYQPRDAWLSLHRGRLASRRHLAVPPLCIAETAAAEGTDFPRIHTLDSNQSTMKEGRKRSLSLRTEQQNSKCGSPPNAPASSTREEVSPLGFS